MLGRTWLWGHAKLRPVRAQAGTITHVCFWSLTLNLPYSLSHKLWQTGKNYNEILFQGVTGFPSWLNRDLWKQSVLPLYPLILQIQNLKHLNFGFLFCLLILKSFLKVPLCCDIRQIANYWLAYYLVHVFCKACVD